VPDSSGASLAIRGPALTFAADPFLVGSERALHYQSDALIVIRNGRIEDFGPASARPVPADLPLTRYPATSLILPGLIDAHVHYPQLPMVAAYGTQLIDWLQKYAYPVEERFADPAHARAVARAFLQQCLRAGTTTAMVYCTVLPQSVDAFFEEAARLNLRMIAGKILMDRHAPAALLDTPERAYDESKALIARWHGRGRLAYAVTPRFAATSSPAQMEVAGALWREHPGTYLQTHLSETADEVAWVRRLYPERRDYLDVYDHYGHVGPRAVFGHGVHLEEREFGVLHDGGAAIAHCPTSNLFLGSGLFKLGVARRAERPVRLGLGTDIGAGTSVSLLQTLNETYKVAQLGGYALNAAHAFYLATRGGAEALYLDDLIGSIAPGREADLAVLDLYSTPLIDYRMRFCEHIADALFVQMMLADDRATVATYVAGALAYERRNLDG
jgi:guanine deaminase